MKILISGGWSLPCEIPMKQKEMSELLFAGSVRGVAGNVFSPIG